MTRVRHSHSRDAELPRTLCGLFGCLMELPMSETPVTVKRQQGTGVRDSIQLGVNWMPPGSHPI
jgi:hypothetical protein